MAFYEVEWKHSAEKDLKDIDRQYIPRIVEIVDFLSNHPFPSQHRKLRGGEASYRIRVGDYRIVYQVDIENKRVVIYRVRHRKDAYQK
jgi:mRNA interferase RelE/StbE